MRRREVAAEWLELGSRRLRVLDQGHGPVLLLLTGLGMPLELWGSLLPYLPDRRVLAVDMPGCGASPAGGAPMTMPGYASVVADVLAAYEVSAADVLGLSFGGMIAQQLALTAPGRVRRLVLASTSCGWGAVPGNPLALLSALTAERLGSRPVFELLAPFYVGGSEGTDLPFLRQQAKVRQALPPNPWSFAYQATAALTWSSLPWLPLIRHPTLVISGTADPLVPWPNATVLRALLPNADCHLVPNGGHLCLLDRAAELGTVITDFLRA